MVPSLVDEIVFGLLPRFFCQPMSQKMAIQLSLTVSKSVLAAQHPLLTGMKEFVKSKGTCSEQSIHVHCTQCTCIYFLFLFSYLLNRRSVLPILHSSNFTFSTIMFICFYTVCFAEWKGCGNSSDLDKLALADSALISWLAENLMKLNEKQLIEKVSVMHVPDLSAPSSMMVRPMKTFDLH